MITKIDCDEEYPVYTLDAEYGDPYEVPYELYERYFKVMKEYREVQKQLGVIYREETNGKKHNQNEQQRVR